MRVLYATDGSAPSREGERLITSMFDPTKVGIDVFSVTPEAGYIQDPIDGRYQYTQLDLPPLDSGEIAGESADHISAAHFKVTARGERGNPAVEILNALRTDPHDLVVLGASHSTWLGNLLLGSVSTHVLHHSPCSVLVAHHAPTGSGRVLIGIDGSAQAQLTSELATRLLDPERSRLSIVMAVNQPWVSVSVYPPGRPFGSYAAYEAAEKARLERAWQMVEKASARLKRLGFESEGSVLSGTPGPQLLKEAENLSADLVVVGSRGMGPIKRAFLGSVSDQVARHAAAALVGRVQTSSR